ncbi:hypothetical protein PEC301937_11600 [Pectobacterium carotovorum subsp. carotovorum]|nr:hypothetical protein PEC301937_11600 [Pectobacterium carotovorum subsp. carotovorum]
MRVLGYGEKNTALAQRLRQSVNQTGNPNKRNTR